MSIRTDAVVARGLSPHTVTRLVWNEHLLVVMRQKCRRCGAEHVVEAEV